MFDYENFVKDYIEALKGMDGAKVLELVNALETEDQRAIALRLVLEALDKDKELKQNNPKIVEILDFICKNANVGIEAKVDVEVHSPSITTTEGKTDEAPAEAKGEAVEEDKEGPEATA